MNFEHKFHKLNMLCIRNNSLEGVMGFPLLNNIKTTDLNCVRITNVILTLFFMNDLNLLKCLF